MTREAIKFFEDLISETERVLADRPEMLREVETVLPYYRMAIEALQERPKGQWIEEYKSYLDPHTGEYWEEVFFKCPICGRWESAKEPFCHCGADMRELPRDKVDVYDSTFSLEYQEKAAEEHFADMRESEE